MAEGVMAVNSDRNIKFLNSAAAKILGIPNERQKGQGIEAVVRVPEIQDFVNLSLKADHPLEKEVELLGATSKHLQLRSSPLKSHDGTRNGTVLVFSDISRLKELESHRRDFVANVSHELRTPLAGLQTTLEVTLEDVAAAAKVSALMPDGRKLAIKLPEQVEVRDELPYNETGKLLRRVLRQELAEAHGDG